MIAFSPAPRPRQAPRAAAAYKIERVQDTNCKLVWLVLSGPRVRVVGIPPKAFLSGYVSAQAAILKVSGAFYRDRRFEGEKATKQKWTNFASRLLERKQVYA